MAYTAEPITPSGEPLYFNGHHNAWFERYYGLESGSVANAYRENLGTSAPFILQSLLPFSLLKRSNAVRERHPHQFGTAGVSGITKRPAIKEQRTTNFGVAGVSGVKRSNAKRERHPHAGQFGTAGISGLSRTDGPKKAKRKRSASAGDVLDPGMMGSFTSSIGVRRSSRFSSWSTETSPGFDQFEDPPM